MLMRLEAIGGDSGYNIGPFGNFIRLYYIASLS